MSCHNPTFFVFASCSANLLRPHDRRILEQPAAAGCDIKRIQPIPQRWPERQTDIMRKNRKAGKILFLVEGR